MPPAASDTERFIRHLTSVQDGVYAYILSLVGDAEAAHDIQQETHVVLWRKFAEFAEGTSFPAWARQIALYQVKAWRRDAARDRLLFDDALLECVAGEAEAFSASVTPRSVALDRCIEKLPAEQRQLIKLRYTDCDAPIQQVADRIGKSLAAVSMSLSRIRHALMECIERALEQGGDA